MYTHFIHHWILLVNLVRISVSMHLRGIGLQFSFIVKSLSDSCKKIKQLFYEELGNMFVSFFFFYLNLLRLVFPTLMFARFHQWHQSSYTHLMSFQCFRCTFRVLDVNLILSEIKILLKFPISPICSSFSLRCHINQLIKVMSANFNILISCGFSSMV